MRCRRLMIPCLVAAALPLTGLAQPAQPVILSTLSDGNIVQVAQDFGTGLPNPTLATVVDLPVDARPHGVAYISDSEALVADFVLPRLYRIAVPVGTVLATISVPARANGNGTVAVSPSGDVAIFAGNVGAVPNQQGQVAVIRAPFVESAAQTTLSLPGNVRGFNTQAVAFARNGRAFICHTAGVSVIDPPYNAVAFTLAATRPNGSNCVLSRDDIRLAVTDNQATTVSLAIYNANAGASAVPVLLPAPAGVGALAGLGYSADGEALLVGQSFRPGGALTDRARLFVVRPSGPPPAVMWTEIVLPDAIRGSSCVGVLTQCPGFEDLALNLAGDLAIVTGNSVTAANDTGRAPLAVIRNPFNDATREVFAVMPGNTANSTQGRGTGSVRFLPPGLPILRDGFE